jgi:hypothetical protein
MIITYDHNSFIIQATAYLASTSATKKKRFITLAPVAAIATFGLPKLYPDYNQQTIYMYLLPVW